MAINLNNTTPAAVNGGTNVTWQNDTSGNVSAYFQIVKAPVTPSAGVVTLNAAVASSFFISVNAAITSMSISNPTDGQEITIAWQQSATGYAVTLAPNMNAGSFVVNTSANLTSVCKWTYNAANGIWYAIGQSGM